MKQVAQILRTGVIDVFDVPVPSLSDDFVLVRNAASLISAGTEKTKVDMGKKSLIQKARARPDLVKQVLKKIRTEGFTKTLQTVNTRLDSLSALGYSCAGTVVAVGGGVKGLRPGDRVACGGADYANHAEMVAVPKNLVVRIPENVEFEEACFGTVGSIALQGLRLADPKLGETFLVVGLGLLGQITVQLLRANGCNVIGTDLDASLAKRAEAMGARCAVDPVDLARLCRDQTAGYGVDGVLVCAGSSSNSIIELCGEVTREKGRVVVVGAVRMDVPREPYFKKEISLVISRSYGPGRYDPLYEEGGLDYPYAYVRFTEQRNIETFVRMVGDGKIDVKGLITHRYDVGQAAEAYGIIEGERREPYLGIVIQYPVSARDVVDRQAGHAAPAPLNRTSIGLSLIGAGNYATASLLPVLKSDSRIGLSGVLTASGRSAQAVQSKFGFAFCTSEIERLCDVDTDVVMIASRHDSHAMHVSSALRAGKHVYVEKPLGLSVGELSEIWKTSAEHGESQLMVGFNRRFAPATREVLDFLGDVSQRVISIRVNAGHIPESHWIQDPKRGGGRIIGEACHFVELASTLAGSLPVSVMAVSLRNSSRTPITNDDVCMSLEFANGSVASITYVASGSKAMNKEYIEVFGGGKSAVIDDFRCVELYWGESGHRKIRYKTQDKGQAAMLKSWVDGLVSGVPCVAPVALFSASLATVLAVESLTVGMPMDVDLDLLSAKQES